MEDLATVGNVAALSLSVVSKTPIRDDVKGEWKGMPPYMRRRLRLWWIPMLMLPLIFGAWMARLWLVPAAGSERWVSFVMPVSLFVPQFVVMIFLFRAMARLRRAYAAAGGRLCTNCAHDLSGLGEAGKCPECGYGFDAEADGVAWKKCGVGK